MTLDDFELSCKGLYRALTIREKYMKLAFQRFPRTASQYLRDIEGETFKPDDQLQPGERITPGLHMNEQSYMLLYTDVSCRQSSRLLRRTERTPSTPRTCQRIWAMWLVWRTVSSTCTTTLQQLTNISPKTCPTPTTPPSSTTWTSLLPSLLRARRESFQKWPPRFTLIHLSGIFHFDLVTLDDPVVSWLLNLLRCLQLNNRQ